MGLIKTSEEIKKLRASATILKETLNYLSTEIKIGISLLELDALAKTKIESLGGKPSFLNYDGFPNSICTSVNEVVLHGIPTGYKLKSGDIISIDVGVVKDGYYSDSAMTLGVGEISAEAINLLKACDESLAKSIKEARPGNTTGDIGFKTEEIVKKYGLNVVKDFIGHGIGTSMHEEPSIPNYGKKHGGVPLSAGMVICIEPMILTGTNDVFIDPLDKWTVRSKNGKLTGHKEAMILITKKGNERLV